MTTTPTLQELPVNGLKPSPHNPRRELAGPALDELADSIKALGVLEPLLVRSNGKGYEILAGHRRAQAAKKAGLASVPCIVRDVDDKTAIEITVTENLQREQLSPLEEAHALESLQKAGWDATTMAAELGKSPTWVARRMSLLNLAPDILKAVSEGAAVKYETSWGRTTKLTAIDRWPARSLELLASVPADAQVLVLQQLRGPEDEIHQPEEVRQALSRILNVLSAAPFDKSDATLNPKLGACTDCDLRASCRKSLFDEDLGSEQDGRIPRNDRCLNPACFEQKLIEHGKRRVADAKKEHGKDVVVVANSPLSRKAFPKAAQYAPYGLAKAGKTAKGAKFYFDADSGKGEWLAPLSRGGNRKRIGAPAVKSLKTRRDELAKRRLAWVIFQIKEEMKQWTRFPTDGAWGKLSDQCKAAIVFGTEQYALSDHAGDGVDLPAGGKAGKVKSVPAWDWFDQVSTATLKDLKPDDTLAVQIAERAYELLQPVLDSRLSFGGQASIIRLDDHSQEAVRVCAIFKLDYEDLCRQAREEIPEPKSWAKLNADGTPKKAPAPKAKKPARSTGSGQAKPAKKGKGRSPKARAGGK